MKTRSYLILCAVLSVFWIAGLLFVPPFANAIEAFIHQFLVANSS